MKCHGIDRTVKTLDGVVWIHHVSGFGVADTAGVIEVDTCDVPLAGIDVEDTVLVLLGR